MLRQGAKGRMRSRKCQCSKDPCAQKVSGGRRILAQSTGGRCMDRALISTWGRVKGQIEGRWVGVAQRKSLDEEKNGYVARDQLLYAL